MAQTKRSSRPKDLLDHIRQARKAFKATDNLPGRGRVSQVKAAGRTVGFPL